MKYQKIRALGHRTIANIWNGEVEITEKVDGSQYRWWRGQFGVADGGFCHGTKRTQLHLVDGGVKDKLFNPVVRHMEEHAHKLPPSIDCIFGETLAKPKHNTLKYAQVPKGHLALWGGYDGSNDHWLTHAQLTNLADDLGVDVVPLIAVRKDAGAITLDVLDELLDQESYLGGTKIEGLVFKNYEQDNQIGDEYIPFLAGKYVSEKFKEKMGQKSRKSHDPLGDYFDSFRTEARWLKAVQHLRESGTLTLSPKDIGPLMQELHKDLVEEHKEEVMEWLYNKHLREHKRRVCWGFPEFYKKWLVENGS
jgi:hypothetical protein